mgnify:CR=1 FL=1
MKVSYKKLWYLCVEREIGKAELRKRTGLSSATFTKLRRNQEVNLSALLKIAEVMNCRRYDGFCTRRCCYRTRRTRKMILCYGLLRHTSVHHFLYNDFKNRGIQQTGNGGFYGKHKA